MAIGPTREIQTLLLDDFSAPVSSITWDYNRFASGGSFYGRTQQRQSLPTVSNGLLHLELDSYNPTALTPGDSFVGSEIISKQTFTTDAGGIAFEASLRIVSPVAGLVGGFFGYNFTSASQHSEVDDELLGNDAAAGRNREQTNVYSNEPLGAGHTLFVPVTDLTAFHTYRMEWFPDRVRWFIDGQFVREDTVHVPQGALAVHLNIWAPAADWADAYDASLKPATTLAANTSYFVDVDYVRVARLPNDGGRFLFGPPAGFTSVTLGINDGKNPIFPAPVAGSFNIEVFTAAGVTTLPTLDSGFQAGVIDPAGTLVAPGYLSGTKLQLFTGNYLVTDALTGSTTGQTAVTATLGSGNQTIIGAPGDTIQGGSGSQVLNAVQQFSGAETIIGGSGPTTVYGGPSDSVVAGSGNTYIDGTAGNMAIGVGTGGSDSIVGTAALNTISGAATGHDTISGGSAAVKVQGLGKGDVISFGNQTGNATINATVGNITATLGGGAASVFGGIGDTIKLGSVGQYADGGAGKMTITDGSAGVDTVFGSSVSGGGTTILGGSASLDFNPQVGGGSDLVNLASSSGDATINAFKAGTTQLTSVNDTIMAGTGSDSVWGGPGDRIGVGASSTAGGTHLFDHSTSIAGAAVAFGTNDSVAGSSTAKATVTNFQAGTDSLFYQNENTTTTASIVATSTTIGGNTTFTLPDGTVMTLIGVSSITTGLFKP